LSETDGIEVDEKSKINETVAYFKINDDLDIVKLYGSGFKPPLFDRSKEQKVDINEEKKEWSLDISNIQKCQHKRNFYKYLQKRQQKLVNENEESHNCGDDYFILVAVSRIDANDMKENEDANAKSGVNTKNNYNKGPLIKKKLNRDVQLQIDQSPTSCCNRTKENYDPEQKKKTAIYCLKLKASNKSYILDEADGVNCYYSDSVSGICRFVDYGNLGDDDDVLYYYKEHHLKRFVILNFHGIYNFKFNEDFSRFNINEKFSYPKCIETELRTKGTGCMDKLLTCLYDQYFLVEQYKNDVQIFEGEYH
jgi:hypothetical protein